MKRSVKSLLAAVLTLVLLSASVLPVGAADFKSKLRSGWVRMNDNAVLLADKSVGLKVGNALLDGAVQPQKTLSELFADKQIVNIFLLSPENVDKVSDTLAQSADICLVQLQDGRKTYYIAVDLRTENAVYLSNLFVLRATSEKLWQRTEQMADAAKGEKPFLMDYTHIVGELELHYLGYRVTQAMGGEQLQGLLRKVYNSCTVADLNADEYRMLAILRVVGLLIG
ncbi:MAG: hypothetical protein ACI4I5_07325 [Acutalibacteraceae bacterium]